MSIKSFPLRVSIFLPIFLTTGTVFAQETVRKELRTGGRGYALYPVTLAVPPDIPSPLTADTAREFLLVSTREGKFAIVNVTVENGNPLHYSRRVGSAYGKDRQLLVDSGDFPTLAREGLHSDGELIGKERITDIPVTTITHIARPGRFSRLGFLANDEDILSVLKGDNRLVRALGLTHPQLAKPLFHVWNLLLNELENGTAGRHFSICGLVYNGHHVSLAAEGGKGWQVSIFQDEIQGRFSIELARDISPEERRFLERHYTGLCTEEMEELRTRLSRLHVSEMAPYYIMRYGFYEGHTEWRADPIAVAFIFGLRTLAQIEGEFPGKLDRVLEEHFIASQAPPSD